MRKIVVINNRVATHLDLGQAIWIDVTNSGKIAIDID